MLRERARTLTSVERKADAHQKIALGGLVVKAGLREEDRALILGILVDGAARLQSDAERARLLALGLAAFNR